MWVNDHCTVLPPSTTSEQRARGILTIHRDCSPPRKLGALIYASLPKPAAVGAFR